MDVSNKILDKYEVLQHQYLKDTGCDSLLLRHKKTGARVALLPCDDDNKVFYIGFRTPPEDSTGVAHIIEHTVLCGSRDFPVKDPFIELVKGSLNTFLNAMTLDIAMGASTNTVLHLLAVAQEAEVDFTMPDIDALSRKVPFLCKLAPNWQKYSIQEENRAGGILGIMGELAKGNLLDLSCKRVNGATLGEDIEKYSILKENIDPEASRIYHSAPGGKFSNVMGSQDAQWESLDTDRANGCIRDIEHAYTKDGGMAVLFGNIAKDGCVVKTAGVAPELWHFEGPAVVFDSQEDACEGILGGKVKKGDCVVITHEGPKGGPGMQEMLYPTSYIKSMHMGKECALITDGRFSGGTSGLSIGHISPEAASGGNIGKIKDGDIIVIDIPSRSINVKLSDEELEARPQQPLKRNRVVSKALRAYAKSVASADKGGVRIID